MIEARVGVDAVDVHDDAAAVAEDAGVYVHVPFCARACPYCDFDFQVGRAVPVQAYLDALNLEAKKRVLPPAPATVYVGGGTPSMLGADGLRALLGWLWQVVDRSRLRECTVELNPEHVDDALVDALVEAGVDRVSIGVQSFEPMGLAELGRVHDAAAADAAVTRCAAAGLRVSADLIVGWTAQDAVALQRDVSRVLDHGVSHVSVYALTIEPGTPWCALVRRGRRRLPRADTQADLLIAAERQLVDAGLSHYEVSSYAVPGDEGRHNAGYWSWRDYVGLGPSAASATFLDDGGVRRRTNVRTYAAWCRAGRETSSLAAEHETLRPAAAAAEGLWTGLRRLDGLDVAAWLQRFHGIDRAWLDARIERQLTRGNLEWVDDGRTLRIAKGRWLLHDGICADLLG